MCTCTQLSKKAVGSLGNFNYVFECTNSDGKKTKIKITSGNDNEAKALAVGECEGDKMGKTILALLESESDGTLRVLLHPTYSTAQNIIVAFCGKERWFAIPVVTLAEVSKIGYGLQENVLYPLIAISFKQAFQSYYEDVLRLKAQLEAGNDVHELPSLPEIIEMQRLQPSQGTTSILELSGARWVGLFPGSNLTNDLTSPFRENVNRFISALESASATVTIAATYRPQERAYLMHTSYQIARGIIRAENAPSFPGVNIEWVHATPAASIQAAAAMVAAYGIVYPPAFPTNHSGRTAIDMNINWSGTLNVRRADGTMIAIASTPRNHLNTELHAVGRSYNVIKNVPDPPHWSQTGN